MKKAGTVKKLTPQAPAIDVEKAQQAIAEDRKKRATECATELEALMKKHNCTLTVAVGVEGLQLIPQLQILPK